MQQLPGFQYRLQIGLKGWASIVVGLAVFIAITSFLAVGFLFVVLPMIVLSPVIYYFRPKKIKRDNAPRSCPMSSANISTVRTAF